MFALIVRALSAFVPFISFPSIVAPMPVTAEQIAAAVQPQAEPEPVIVRLNRAERRALKHNKPWAPKIEPGAIIRDARPA